MRQLFFKSVVFCGALLLLLGCKTASDPYEQIAQIEERIKAPKIPDAVFNVAVYGAVGDSVTDNKLAFDLAISACNKNGGGKIVVPAGVYLIDGPIHLGSYTELHVAEGATIKFGSNPDDYLPVVKSSWEGTFIMNYSPFIYAYGKTDIAITGKGCIDGEATHTWAKWRAIQRESQILSREMNHTGVPIEERIFGKGHFLRPQLVQFFECENILIEDTRFEDAPFWCIHLLKTKSVRIRRISYDTQNPNNDGVDPEYAEDVIIENVSFNNSDDNVAVKAGRDHEGRAQKTGSRNIVVRNCNFKGLHGIVIGSEMSAGVENVFVENCGFDGYVKRGIYLKSNRDRGGFIRNIYCRNLAFGEVLDCFFVTSNYKNEGEGFPTPISNIQLENITCQKANNYGLWIVGAAELPISGLRLTNVAIENATMAIQKVNVNYLELNNVTVNGEVVE